VRDGFELALKQAGNKDVELIIEDDARKPDLAVQLADKLIQSDKVDVMTGIIWSNLAMAVIPGAVAQGKIYLSPNAGPSALAGAGCNENYFNVAWQNDNLHEAMGAYATSAGFKKSFILAPNYPAGKDALTGFKRFFKGEVAKEIYTKLGQTDYAAEIAEIRASDADSVFFFLPGGMGIAFMKQYAGAGVDVPLLGPAFSFDQAILQAVGDARLASRTRRSGPRTSTTRPTRPSSKASRPSMAVCRRSTRARASTPPTCCSRQWKPRRSPTSRCLPRSSEGGQFQVNPWRFQVRQ
jgi:branched-chain amino acid transport system substrate-binding protein